jgi:hypothetical protein
MTQKSEILGVFFSRITYPETDTLSTRLARKELLRELLSHMFLRVDFRHSLDNSPTLLSEKWA